MSMEIEYHEKLLKDFKKLKLSNDQLIKLRKKITDISRNPYPKSQGGLGEPLRSNLKGLLKFRFDDDYRVVYRIIKEDDVMKIIVVGLRTDSLVYNKAEERK